jgi:hypothetical protein
MSQLNNETKEKLYLPDAYLETLDLFLKNKDKLMIFSVKEPNFFEVNVYCKYHYVVENDFEKLKNDAMLKVKDLELLTMIQHFVSNIDLENSTFSKTKKGLFFILKSTDEQIIPIFIDDMHMKFNLSFHNTDISVNYKDFI